MLLYFGELISRSSCESCLYAYLERISDIAIGDHWSVQVVDANFYSRDGVSLVFVNTDKGAEYFEKAYSDLEIVEVELNDFMQPNLRGPSKMSGNRFKFWQDFTGQGFEFVSRKYGDNTMKGHAKSIVKRILGTTRLTKMVKKVMKI